MKDFPNRKWLWAIFSRSYGTTSRMRKAVNFFGKMIEKGLWEQGAPPEASEKTSGSSEWVEEGSCWTERSQ